MGGQKDIWWGGERNNGEATGDVVGPTDVGSNNQPPPLTSPAQEAMLLIGSSGNWRWPCKRGCPSVAACRYSIVSTSVTECYIRTLLLR